MKREEKLQKMLELAKVQCQGLMKEKYAVGAFLFGSAVSGDIHDGSDVDLAVVYNTVAADIRVGKEEKKIDDIRVEIWRYPIGPFIQTFEDETLRNKPDTWMWASLWVEYMKTGLILEDPTKRLAEWKEKAKKWKWRETEIRPAVNQGEDNVQASERHLLRHSSLESLICLREALTCLTAAYVMKHGLIPSFRPKEISLKLGLIRDKEKNLSAVFDLVNNSTVLDYNLVESLELSLKEFIDAEWGEKRLGPRTELENARSSLRNRDLLSAIVSLQYAAYWLGFHILNKRGKRLKAEICNGENHVEMIHQLATAADSFYEFYKKLQLEDKWNFENMQSAINQTRTVLDDSRNIRDKD